MPYAMRAFAEAEPASKGDYATCFYVQQGRQCGIQSRQSCADAALLLLVSYRPLAHKDSLRQGTRSAYYGSATFWTHIDMFP